MIDIFFRLYNPSPPRPKTPFTHVVYLYNDAQFSKGHLGSRGEASKNKLKDQYLTLYSVNMTYNLKKSIIQWESVCICFCLRPRCGSLSAQCVVLRHKFHLSNDKHQNFKYILYACAEGILQSFRNEGHLCP